MRNKILALGLISLFLIFIPCCTKTPTSPDVNGALKPVISSFTASSTAIYLGESSILSWSVSNATQITIDNGIGAVSASGSITVSPVETTTYTLTASNSAGQASRSVTVGVTAQAIFELTSYVYGYTSYNCCNITGTVKNIGSATGYNVMIEFQAYNANDVIIDTARGFPAGLGNIPVGISAAFEAIFFDTYNWSSISKTTYEITWLTAAGMRLTQTGIVPFK